MKLWAWSSAEVKQLDFFSIQKWLQTYRFEISFIQVKWMILSMDILIINDAICGYNDLASDQTFKKNILVGYCIPHNLYAGCSVFSSFYRLRIWINCVRMEQFKFIVIFSLNFPTITIMGWNKVTFKINIGENLLLPLLWIQQMNKFVLFFFTICLLVGGIRNLETNYLLLLILDDVLIKFLAASVLHHYK